VKLILGISAYYHDSAACLIRDGHIVAAVQEERFTRHKNTSDFPEEAIRYCLKEGNISLMDIDAIVFYDKPFLKFERLLENFYSVAPKGLFAFLKFMPEWSQKKIFLKSEIKKALKAIDPSFKEPINLLFSSHHLSHAASAYYPSPFAEAAILTIDAIGEWATASIGHGKDSKIELLKEMHFPDSVGLLYSSFTYFLGFKVNSGEYKLMGLSPYGNEESESVNNFVEQIKKELVTIYDDGSILLNQSYFKYRYGLRMIREEKWIRLFGVPARKASENLEKIHADLALAIQLVTEEIILKMAQTAKVLTGSKNLCLAGGVALNSVANGKLIKSGLFEDIWVQPAAGDAGGALGAALAVYYSHHENVLTDKQGEDTMQMSLLGPENTEESIVKFYEKNQLAPRHIKENEELFVFIAKELMNQQVVGWVRGRMEFGPRALGARSILAAPFEGDMQSKLNRAIKFREDFRPFAPVMLREEANRYFGLSKGAHYMQFVLKIKEEYRRKRSVNYEHLNFKDQLNEPRTRFQSISHVDFSSRVQVIDNDNHPLFHLLNHFKVVSGDAVLINTSFNRNEEPIVNTIEDAYATFIHSDMDLLVVGNYIFTKK